MKISAIVGGVPGGKSFAAGRSPLNVLFQHRSSFDNSISSSRMPVAGRTSPKYLIAASTAFFASVTMPHNMRGFPLRIAGFQELQFMKPLINPAGVNEFVVAARFNDAAAVEDYDLVGAANGGQAMSDDDDGAPFDEIG